MIIEELEIVWRSGARTHRLVVDVDGIPTLDGEGPARSEPTRAEPARPARAEAPRDPALGRRGKAWSEEEEARLREGFAAGTDAAAMARELGRSRGAVTARLVRMGLLTEAEAGLRYPVSRPPSGADGAGSEAESGAESDG